MNYIAEIDIMPLKELLDPQGKTVANNMKNIDLEGVEDVRIGKHIRMTFVAYSRERESRNGLQKITRQYYHGILPIYDYG